MIIPYQPGTPDNWDEGVPELRVDQAGKALVGPCPRCGPHQLSFDLDDQDGVGLAPDEPEKQSFLVTCNCSRDHPDRPPGSFGCGAYGNVVLSL